MTVKAKAIVDAFYGSAPTQLAIWNGCSLGGRQGITEAQRYPADFDAIIAGAPAVNWMRLHGARMAINQRAHARRRQLYPAEQIPGDSRGGAERVRRARTASRTAWSRIRRACRFDPKVLECKGPDGPGCLTPAQVETARALYAPLKSAKTGATIFPSLLLPGSEPDWATLGRARPGQHGV